MNENLDKLLEYLDAFKRGKKLQVRDLDDNTWQDVRCYKELLCTGIACIRYKPEPKLRPYTFEEMCEAVKKHGIVVKSKTDTEVTTILNFDKENVFYFNEFIESYSDFAKGYVWLDDNSPCGIIEE